MELQDPYTQNHFVPNRSNQKFESKKSRQDFHNEVAKKIRHSLAEFNRPLYINYKVLSELMVNAKDATYHKEYLKGKGIDFTIHTHSDVFEDKTYGAIYNFILIKLENEKIRIIKLIAYLL